MRVVRVVDPDTVDVEVRVRLAGVYAPETGEEGAEECKARLEELAPVGARCRLFHALGETTYGRLVGDLIVDGNNVGHVLVREGLAATGPVPLTPAHVTEEDS